MIERLTLDDLAEAAEIEKTCFSRPWSKVALGMLLSEPYCGFALRVDGKLLAYVGMFSVAGEAQVLNLATLPEYRGRGYGRQLLMRLFDEARARGCDTVTLEVRESNSPARGLYESVGFMRVGYIPDSYKCPREAAIIMEKKL